MKTKLIMMAVALISLFGLSSCIEVESTISMKKDGSGTITEDVYFAAQALQMMQAQGANGDPFADMLDEEKAKAKAKTMGEGVTFVSAEKIKAAGKEGVRVTYAFKDINTLQYDGSGVMNDLDPNAEADKDEDKKLPTFSYKAGVLTLKNNEDAMDLGDMGEMENSDPQELAMAAAMFQDARIAIKLKIVDGIAETNATFVEGDTVSLADVSLGKMLSNGAKLKEAAKAQDVNKAGEILNSIDGVNIETQKEVTIKVK